jgi:DNA-binding MarR family transcriptional regulator
MARKRTSERAEPTAPERSAAAKRAAPERSPAERPARSERRGAASAERIAAVELAVRKLIASSILFNHQVTQRLGLGASDAQFMHFLQLHGPLTPSRLAELSGLTTGTVTGVVDRLEDAGFVRRERDASDRRKVLVTLNEEHLWREMAPLYAGQAESLANVAGRYDAAQLEVIADFLERLVDEAPSGLPDA